MSHIGDIESGLRDLVRVIKEHGITSIAVPPLGAGNGGLSWSEVEPLIIRTLGNLPDTRTVLYTPTHAARHLAPNPIKMTWV
jgi:O-acetyl-ADP-ribose deacetylase (regulator of RNase III)